MRSPSWRTAEPGPRTGPSMLVVMVPSPPMVAVMRGSRPEPVLRRGTHVLPDVLGFAVLLQPRAPELTADPGLLETTPLRLRYVRVVVVDPDRAVPESAG